MKAIIAAVAISFAFLAQVKAAEIKVLSPGAFRGILPTLAPEFERLSGHKVTFSIYTPIVLTERLLKGEPADVAFATASTAGQRLAVLEKAGRIIAGSLVELGGAFVAVAIRAGQPKPDLSNPEAVKRTLRAAKSVAISDPSGGTVQGRFISDPVSLDTDLTIMLVTKEAGTWGRNEESRHH